MEITIDFVTLTLVVLAILVVILSYFEMHVSKIKSVYRMPLPKEKVMIGQTDLRTSYPVYVYNVKRAKKEPVVVGTDEDKDYIDTIIPVHLGARIMNPIKQMFHLLSRVPRSSMPLNKLYLGLSKSDEIMTNVNPLAPVDDTEYHAKIHKSDINKIEVFMDDKIYFVR